MFKWVLRIGGFLVAKELLTNSSALDDLKDTIKKGIEDASEAASNDPRKDIGVRFMDVSSIKLLNANPINLRVMVQPRIEVRNQMTFPIKSPLITFQVVDGNVVLANARKPIRNFEVKDVGSRSLSPEFEFSGNAIGVLKTKPVKVRIKMQVVVPGLDLRLTLGQTIPLDLRKDVEGAIGTAKNVGNTLKDLFGRR